MNAPIPRTSPFAMLFSAAQGNGHRREAVAGGQHLVSAECILEAARWRLRDWSLDRIEATVAAMDAALSIEEKLESILLGGLMPDDGRDVFVASCAVLALLAYAKGDMALLLQAGYPVLDAHRQSTRAAGPRTGDSLTNLIEPYIREGFEPHEIWGDLIRQIECDENNMILDAFDPERGLLSYQARPHDEETTKISYQAFRRRVQRVRNRILGFSGRQCSFSVGVLQSGIG